MNAILEQFELLHKSSNTTYCSSRITNKILRSTITLFVLTFAVLGLLLGFAQSYDAGQSPPSNENRSFTVDVVGEQFVVRATDNQTIQQLIDNYEGKNSMHITGNLVRGDGGFNQPWSWHLDPASMGMAEISIEVCDGRPSYVEEHLDEWLATVGDTYCPWGSRIIAIN